MKKNRKRYIWLIIVGLLVCWYVGYRIDLNIPRGDRGMEREAYRSREDILDARSMRFDVPFSCPVAIDTTYRGQEQFITYRMITMLGQDTLFLTSTVSRNKRTPTKTSLGTKDPDKDYLLFNHKLYYQGSPRIVFVNHSDSTVCVAAYCRDIMQDTISYPDPTQFPYKLVPPGDSNEYCLQNFSIMEGRGSDFSQSLRDSCYVYIYDIQTFNDYAWCEIRQKGLYLKRLVLSEKQIFPSTRAIRSWHTFA